MTLHDGEETTMSLLSICTGVLVDFWNKAILSPIANEM